MARGLIAQAGRACGGGTSSRQALLEPRHASATMLAELPLGQSCRRKRPVVPPI